MALSASTPPGDYSTPPEHTPDNPYCAAYPCWCHTDSDYHKLVISQEASEEQIALAYGFFEIS